MKERLIFFLKYFIFWIVFFIFFRLVFVIYHIGKFPSIGVGDFMLIFINGMKLDLSMTGYFVLFPTLLLMFLSWFKNDYLMPIIKVYTLSLLILVTILEITDLELYNYWRFRLDETFLDYINTPKEMLASLYWYHYPILMIAIGSILVIFYLFLYKRFVHSENFKNLKGNWQSSFIFLFIIPALIIPIRGGLSTSPINTGAVYFHTDLVVNHAALNPIWNLMFTLTENKKLKFKVSYFDKEKEADLLQNLKQSQFRQNNVLKMDRPNVLLIILESFSGMVVEEIGGMKGYTPNFSKLIHDGILFRNFYSTGSSSNTGIGGIIADYPSLPKTCILHYEKKSQTLPSIGESLYNEGYNNAFFYGGDINFAHIKSFLINCKFERIVSHVDFPKEDYYSKWGVPDHKVYKRLLEETTATERPFFHIMFSLSSHEPFDVPMEPAIEMHSNQDRYLNSIIYADKALGDFIEEAKQQTWWDSTLVILLADHGSRFKDISIIDRERFSIPMLWLGGVLNVRDSIIDKYGSQTDIAATLLNQFSLDVSEFKFSKDLLDPHSKSYAFYNCHEGFGFVADSLYMIFDMNLNDFTKEVGSVKEKDRDIVKAYLQYILHDFTSR